MHPYVADKLIDAVSLVILSVNDVGNRVIFSSLISKKIVITSIYFQMSSISALLYIHGENRFTTK
jgi:hypothetical protein